jgi:hypothetical protein
MSPDTDNNIELTRTPSAHACARATPKLAESRSDMTAPAIFPKPAVMDVFPVVAINTTSTRRIHFVSGARVTGLTRNLFVRTVERESCLVVVIEVPNSPVAWIVANVADRPQFSLVRIILAMAAHTVARRILEPLSLVATLALDLQMTSE